MRFLDFASVFVVLNLTCNLALAEHVAEPELAIVLRDGTTLVGHILEQGDLSLRVRTLTGLELDVARETVVSIRARELESNTEPEGDPNYSRLMFAPTGRPLAQGDGYFSDHYVLFPGFSYGLTDNVSLSGGLSVIPYLGLTDQVFYVSPKIGARVSTHTWLSAGVLYAGVGRDDALGMGFGVATRSGRAGSASVGLGVARRVEEDYSYRDGYRKRAKYTPILMLGGTLPVGKRVALVSENWLVMDKDFDIGRQPLGLALRFFGDRLSADVGAILIGDVIKEGFPIPWLSFSYHFGGSRRGHSARSTLPPDLSLVSRAARAPRS
jgi:hypothetical protein